MKAGDVFRQALIAKTKAKLKQTTVPQSIDTAIFFFFLLKEFKIMYNFLCTSQLSATLCWSFTYNSNEFMTWNFSFTHTIYLWIREKELREMQVSTTKLDQSQFLGSSGVLYLFTCWNVYLLPAIFFPPNYYSSKTICFTNETIRLALLWHYACMWIYWDRAFWWAWREWVVLDTEQSVENEALCIT